MAELYNFPYYVNVIEGECIVLPRHDGVAGMLSAMYARNMILFTLLCRRDAVYYCGALSTGGDGHCQVFFWCAQFAE
ncbi:hypothetical protein LG58_1740 [Kosakonia radicincitans YD4]|nr:hypothetical protein LG58_1740 [Kosakonia radicincitans YD4]